MSTLKEISKEIKRIEELVKKAEEEGEIPKYGSSGHLVINETLGILQSEINANMK